MEVFGPNAREDPIKVFPKLGNYQAIALVECDPNSKNAALFFGHLFA